MPAMPRFGKVMPSHGDVPFFDSKDRSMWGIHLRNACLAVLVMLVSAAPAWSAEAKTEGKTGTKTDAKTGHAKKTGEEGPITSKPHEVDLAVWSLIVFIVFVVVLKKLAWAPLSKALDQRQSKIEGDLQGAEEARVKAERMLVEHQQKLDAVQDEVREIIAEARRDAETTKQDIIETAQKEAEAMQSRAVGEIERARDAALKDLFDQVTTQVTQATETVVGRSLTGEDHSRLIDEALREISAKN